MHAAQIDSHKLAALIDAHSEAARASHHLAREMPDLSTRMVMELVARDIVQNQALLRRVVGTVEPSSERVQTAEVNRCANTPRLLAQMAVLSRTALAQAQALRDLACAARGLNRMDEAMLLDAVAADGDKHARLLGALARYVQSLPCEP